LPATLTLLLRIAPPLHGWTHYCVACQHMTSPQAVLDAAMRDKPAAALGIVSAWPAHLDIEYIAPNGS
jgi:hypothetical protein